MFILFGMPIAQIMLFGFAITNEINNVNIAFLDKSKDTETIQIINKISASKHFNIQDEIGSENQIENIFKKGKIKAVLVFKKTLPKIYKRKKKQLFKSSLMLQTQIRQIRLPIILRQSYNSINKSKTAGLYIRIRFGCNLRCITTQNSKVYSTLCRV